MAFEIDKETQKTLILSYLTLPTYSNFRKKDPDGSFSIDGIVDRIQNYGKFEEQYF